MWNERAIRLQTIVWRINNIHMRTLFVVVGGHENVCIVLLCLRYSFDVLLLLCWFLFLLPPGCALLLTGYRRTRSYSVVFWLMFKQYNYE